MALVDGTKLEEVERIVERILEAAAEPRATAHFAVLNLPLPSIDALGRPSWSTPASEVSKAYRNISRHVHPDKIQDDALKTKARDAFEAVKTAHAKLSNDDTRDAVLREYAAAMKERGALEGRHNDKTLDEKVDAMSKELDERKRLREEEYVSMTGEIQKQLEEKRARALLVKKKRAERQERQERQEGAAGSAVFAVDAGECHGKRDGPVKAAESGSESDDGRARRRRQQNRRRERRK